MVNITFDFLCLQGQATVLYFCWTVFTLLMDVYVCVYIPLFWLLLAWFFNCHSSGVYLWFLIFRYLFSCHNKPFNTITNHLNHKKPCVESLFQTRDPICTPLQGKDGVLTPGWPGKSPNCSLKWPLPSVMQGTKLMALLTLSLALGLGKQQCGNSDVN